MNTMTYRGFTARVDFSAEDECFVGRLLGTSDVVGFHAESVAALKAAFIEAVEDYLETCEKLGRKAQKPYSGRVLLRLPPELHAKLAAMAQLHGKSLNQWAMDVLAAAK